MQRITRRIAADLHDVAGTRRIEAAAAARLPPHALMERAGTAVARLALALAPHARCIWIACGPGNNGGDGLVAATELRRRGARPIVTLLGSDERRPPDASAALARAREAGVRFAEAPPADFDLAIDALLGIGAVRPIEGEMASWLIRMRSAGSPLLSIDLPSGLDADTGHSPQPALRGELHRAGPRHCLCLLTLKPGLFTADGRDLAGEVWLDTLEAGCDAAPPVARLGVAGPVPARLHASHKGSFGDVAVIGGAPGMAGAALLAASAALHAGAGRVYLAALDAAGGALLASTQPELMLRDPSTLDLQALSVACGCGGGGAIPAALPRVLSSAARLVLDADALNAVAADTALQTLLVDRAARGAPTVLTPHPLEAARLLQTDAATIQANRLGAARRLVERFGAVVVLKGSGTVIAANDRLPSINTSGNGALATAGTGDVLAGMIAAALAAGQSAADAACDAVWHHGDLADRWPVDMPLTAGTLARGAVPASA